MTGRPEDFDLDVSIPMPEGLRVTTDMPYRMLLVADLAGSEQASISGPLADGLVDVDAKTFDDVMAAASPALRFTLTDPLAAAGAPMVEVNLRFDSLRAFDPKNLARQVSAAQAMLQVRDSLVGRMRGKLSAAQLTQAVNQAASEASLAWLTEAMKWSPAAPASAPDAVEGLLGQLDLGGEDAGTGAAAPPPPKTPIGAIVSAAAGGTSIPAEEASAIRRTLAELDRRVSRWLTTVLHSPQVQAIEAAWRSLAFLVSHTEFRKGLRLSVLHAPTAQIADRFRSRVIDPVFDQGAEAPDLIVLDYQFGNTAPDLEILDELAQHGASLPAVVLAGVSSGFFGVKQAWQVPTLPALVSMFDQWQFAKWKTLRDQPYARSLGVVFGRCLLRAPYGREETADLEFAYREECVTIPDGHWELVTRPAPVAYPVGYVGYGAGHWHGDRHEIGGGHHHYAPAPARAPTAAPYLRQSGPARGNPAANTVNLGGFANRFGGRAEVVRGTR